MVLSSLFHLLGDCSVTNTILFFFFFFRTNNVRETYCVWCLEGEGSSFNVMCFFPLTASLTTALQYAMKSRRIMASSFMKDASSMFSDTFGMVQIFFFTLNGLWAVILPNPNFKLHWCQGIFTQIVSVNLYMSYFIWQYISLIFLKNFPYSRDNVKHFCASCNICVELKPLFYQPTEEMLIKATQPEKYLSKINLFPPRMNL